MKSYLAYIRVSTVKQGEHGSSLQEQRSAIEAYAARNDLTIITWYEETETAAKLGREMFSRLLTELKRGNAAGVIIHKIDRSARNLKDWAHLGELIDMGVDVRFAHESLDMASRGGRLAADIQAVVAADYIRNLRQEVRKGFYGRLKQGFYPLPAPRGYIDNGKAQAKTIDPVFGPLIRLAFELYATGQHSFETLRHEMARQGLRDGRGRALTRDVLAKILHNTFYIGLIHIRRTGEVFQGLHEPLVRPTIFDRVQAVAAGRTFSKPQKHDPLFRRLLKCGSCKRSLTGELQRKNYYYRCHSRTCHGTSVKETVLIEIVNAFFEAITLSDEELRDLRDLVQDQAKTVKSNATVRRQEQRQALRLCEGRLTRLTDAFLDNAIDKEIYDQRKGDLLQERARLTDEINTSANHDDGHTLLEKFEMGNMAVLGPHLENAQEVRKKVQETISNIAVCGKEVVFTPQFPFGEVLKMRHPLVGGPSGCTLRTGDTKLMLRTAQNCIVTIDLSGSVEPNLPANDFLRLMRRGI